MSKLSDVTIIGGGIIGLMTARECVNAGAQVTIIDKSEIGQESSWAGGGILLPLYPWRQSESITQLVLQSLLLYPKMTAELNHHSGIDPECLESGMLITQNPDIDEALAWCAHNNILHTTPPSSLLETIDTDINHPLWLPNIRQVRNPRLLQALKADLMRKDVQFLTHCELVDINIQHQKVHSIRTSTGDYPIQQLIISAGAWTGNLWQQLFPWQSCPQPAIHPIKGQMLLFETQPLTLTSIILDAAHYLIPRRDGKILVGSTVEYTDFTKETDTETQLKLTQFAQKLLPALQQFPVIKHWAGLRPGTNLGIPYIARHPELVNVSINAGHFRNGLAMAPAAAELLVDLLLDRPPKINAAPFQLHSIH